MNAMDMKVNSLPAPTWRWLRMNGSTLGAVQITGESCAEMELPEEGIEYALSPEATQDCPTAIGPDMDRLIREAGAGVNCFAAAGRVSGPLRLSFEYGPESSCVDAIELETADNAEMTVIMDYRALADASGFAGVQTRMKLGRNSAIRLVQIQRMGGTMTFLNDVGSQCAEGAKVELIQIVLEGHKTYMGSFCELQGASSDITGNVAYLVRGDEHLDMNYVARHEGVRTTSELNASGVLRDRGFKLFRGTIDFRRGAAQAVGNEKEDALLMDDNVVNQTIPLILCEEEDVEGNHGATIGRLDDSLLFYLESRGLSREAVYEMMARARLWSVCAKIPDEQTRKDLEAYLNGGEESHD